MAAPTAGKTNEISVENNPVDSDIVSVDALLAKSGDGDERNGGLCDTPKDSGGDGLSLRSCITTDKNCRQDGVPHPPSNASNCNGDEDPTSKLGEEADNPRDDCANIPKPSGCHASQAVAEHGQAKNPKDIVNKAGKLHTGNTTNALSARRPKNKRHKVSSSSKSSSSSHCASAFVKLVPSMAKNSNFRTKSGNMKAEYASHGTLPCAPMVKVTGENVQEQANRQANQTSESTRREAFRVSNASGTNSLSSSPSPFPIVRIREKSLCHRNRGKRLAYSFDGVQMSPCSPLEMVPGSEEDEEEEDEGMSENDTDSCADRAKCKPTGTKMSSVLEFCSTLINHEMLLHAQVESVLTEGFTNFGLGADNNGYPMADHYPIPLSKYLDPTPGSSAQDGQSGHHANLANVLSAESNPPKAAEECSGSLSLPEKGTPDDHRHNALSEMATARESDAFFRGRHGQPWSAFQHSQLPLAMENIDPGKDSHPGHVIANARSSAALQLTTSSRFQGVRTDALIPGDIFKLPDTSSKQPLRVSASLMNAKNLKRQQPAPCCSSIPDPKRKMTKKLEKMLMQCEGGFHFKQSHEKQDPAASSCQQSRENSGDEGQPGYLAISQECMSSNTPLLSPTQPALSNEKPAENLPQQMVQNSTLPGSGSIGAYTPLSEGEGEGTNMKPTGSADTSGHIHDDVPYKDMIITETCAVAPLRTSVDAACRNDATVQADTIGHISVVEHTQPAHEDSSPDSSDHGNVSAEEEKSSPNNGEESLVEMAIQEPTASNSDMKGYGSCQASPDSCEEAQLHQNLSSKEPQEDSARQLSSPPSFEEMSPSTDSISSTRCSASSCAPESTLTESGDATEHSASAQELDTPPAEQPRQSTFVIPSPLQNIINALAVVESGRSDGLEGVCVGHAEMPGGSPCVGTTGMASTGTMAGGRDLRVAPVKHSADQQESVSAESPTGSEDFGILGCETLRDASTSACADDIPTAGQFSPAASDQAPKPDTSALMGMWINASYSTHFSGVLSGSLCSTIPYTPTPQSTPALPPAATLPFVSCENPFVRQMALPSHVATATDNGLSNAVADMSQDAGPSEELPTKTDNQNSTLTYCGNRRERERVRAINEHYSELQDLLWKSQKLPGRKKSQAKGQLARRKVSKLETLQSASKYIAELQYQVDSLSKEHEQLLQQRSIQGCDGSPTRKECDLLQTPASTPSSSVVTKSVHCVPCLASTSSGCAPVTVPVVANDHAALSEHNPALPSPLPVCQPCWPVLWPNAGNPNWAAKKPDSRAFNPPTVPQYQQYDCKATEEKNLLHLQPALWKIPSLSKTEADPHATGAAETDTASPAAYPAAAVSSPVQSSPETFAFNSPGLIHRNVPPLEQHPTSATSVSNLLMSSYTGFAYPNLVPAAFPGHSMSTMNGHMESLWNPLSGIPVSTGVANRQPPQAPSA
eukprot:scpid12825/ scgid3759/ 